MKKKFASLIMILIMCMSVFTGCSLVGRSDKNYFEATVATITYTTGEVDKVSKRDLISAYNSYGYNYVNNYGYTKKQAITTTLETVINQKITVKAVEKYYQDNPTEGDMLNGNETTYLWDTTYDSLYSNLKTYLNEVLGNASSSSNSDTSSSDTNASIYTGYTTNAYLEKNASGKYVIKKTVPASTTRDSYKGRKNADGVYVDFEYSTSTGSKTFQEAMYNKIYSLIDSDEGTSAKNWKSAFAKYITAIKDNYTYKTFANDKECFMFEMDRVYNILKDNYVVTKYEEIFNNAKHQNADLSNVTVSNVLDYYSAKVRADYTTYVVEGDTTTYASTILSDVGSVDYILEGNDASNYFYVGYIKLAMTTEQSAELTSLESKLATNSIDYAYYETEVERIYNSICATVRDSESGEATTTTVSSQDLLKKINEEVLKYQYITVNDLSEAQIAEAESENKTLNQYVEEYNLYTVAYQRADAFRTYLYLYNDDDTLKNADYNAVFGVDSTNNVLASDTFSSNDDVKDAILTLFNNDNAQIGDTTDFVRASDGLYMFFYAGKIGNIFSGIDENFDLTKQESNVLSLTSARLNIFSNKTVFDSIYDSLTQDNFSVFQNMDMNNLRTNMTTKIVGIENNLKDLYK